MTLAALLLLSAAGARAAGFAPLEGLRFDATAEELSAACAESARRAETALREDASLSPAARTFDDTVWALDRAAGDLADETAAAALLARVSASSATRAAGRACDAGVAAFASALYLREDLSRAVKEYAAKNEPLTGEDARLLERTLLDFRRAGLELSADKRAELDGLRRGIAAHEAAFERALAAAKGPATLSREELAGLPEDFVAALPRAGDGYRLPLDFDHYFPFMEQARDPAARRKVQTAFDDRAAETNVSVLSETLDLRRRAARLLGYSSHADYAAETGAARDAATVESFLRRLRARLTPAAREELDALTALKRATEGRESDRRIHAWDWPFYDQLLRVANYPVDDEKAAGYFPVEGTVERLLALSAKTFGLRFEEVQRPARWHPDARLYSISGAAGGAPLAWVYLDLYAREGKPERPETVALAAGRRRLDGAYEKPVTALLASFDPPRAGHPSLLRHDELAALLREFGRVLQLSLTKAKYARFSGGGDARDARDVPALTLESWAWDPAALTALSGRAGKPEETLPPGLRDALIAVRRADAALAALRQVLFAEVDQFYHARRPPSDVTRAYAKLARDVALIPIADGTHPEAGFAHLMNGYDGAYYGYLWSKTWAADAARDLRGAAADPAVGRRFRTEVLERGGTRDAAASLAAFLGRPPNEDAYVRSLTDDGGRR